MFSASYAFNEANIQKAYGTYLTKLRTCSPYTYNVDGVPYIAKILGRYNRRCVVRMYSYTTSAECNFKNEEIRAYLKTMPSPKQYTELRNASYVSQLNSETTNQLKENIKTYFGFMPSDTCKISGDEKKDIQ